MCDHDIQDNVEQGGFFAVKVLMPLCALECTIKLLCISYMWLFFFFFAGCCCFMLMAHGGTKKQKKKKASIYSYVSPHYNYLRKTGISFYFFNKRHLRHLYI